MTQSIWFGFSNFFTDTNTIPIPFLLSFHTYTHKQSRTARSVQVGTKIGGEILPPKKQNNKNRFEIQEGGIVINLEYGSYFRVPILLRVGKESINWNGHQQPDIKYFIVCKISCSRIQGSFPKMERYQSFIALTANRASITPIADTSLRRPDTPTDHYSLQANTLVHALNSDEGGEHHFYGYRRCNLW